MDNCSRRKVARILLAWFWKVAVVVLAGMLPGLALAQGGPPLLTDDPETPGDRHSELNIAFTIEKSKGESLFEVPLLDFNYGVGDRIQLKCQIPWLIRNETSENTRSGLGNLLLGFKWRFLDENPSSVDVSIYPQFDFNTTA